MINKKRVIIGAHLCYARDGSPVYTALAGTVGVTNGSTALTGAGTAFEAALANNSSIVIITPTGPVVVQIAAADGVTSNIAAVLAVAWAGATGEGLTAGVQTSTSGCNNKPTDSPGNWNWFSTVENSSLEVKRTEEDVMAPSPGRYRRIDRLVSQSVTDITTVTQEVNELVLESLLESGVLTDGTAFEPNSELGQVRGWWQFKKYDQEDNLILLLELYGIMTVKVLKAENKQYKPSLDLAILYNPLATGTSTLAEA